LFDCEVGEFLYLEQEENKQDYFFRYFGKHIIER
jgi:hypothetical protein